jgi:hypothetical protein
MTADLFLTRQPMERRVTHRAVIHDSLLHAPLCLHELLLQFRIALHACLQPRQTGLYVRRAAKVAAHACGRRSLQLA